MRNTCRWISSPWNFNSHYSVPESFPGVGVEIICDRPLQLGSGLRLALPGCTQLCAPADPMNWGCGAPLQGCSSGGRVLLMGCAGLWENSSRAAGKILQGRLCFLGGLHQRDGLDHPWRGKDQNKLKIYQLISRAQIWGLLCSFCCRALWGVCYMFDKDPPVAASTSSFCWSFEVYEVWQVMSKASMPKGQTGQLFRVGISRSDEGLHANYH